MKAAGLFALLGAFAHSNRTPKAIEKPYEPPTSGRTGEHTKRYNGPVKVTPPRAFGKPRWTR